MHIVTSNLIPLASACIIIYANTRVYTYTRMCFLFLCFYFIQFFNFRQHEFSRNNINSNS